MRCIYFRHASFPLVPAFCRTSHSSAVTLPHEITNWMCWSHPRSVKLRVQRSRVQAITRQFSLSLFVIFITSRFLGSGYNADLQRAYLGTGRNAHSIHQSRPPETLARVRITRSEMHHNSTMVVCPDTPKWDFGLMYFVYGRDEASVISFLKQAIFSATRFKKLNPQLKIGVWTTSEMRPSVFDFIGTVPKKTVVNDRQWLTRINFMRCSPFRLTLAVDTQALACSRDIFSLLSQFYANHPKFDIAFHSKYYNSPMHQLNMSKERSIFASHNWMLLYQLNSRTKIFLDEWFNLHEEEEMRSPGRDDQTTLAKTLKRNLQLVRATRLCSNFAVAFVEDHRGTDKKHRATHELSPGPCHVFHLAVSTEAEADRVCSQCENSSRIRIHVQRHKTAYHTAYSQEEYNRLVNSSTQLREWSQLSCLATSVVVPDYFPDY